MPVTRQRPLPPSISTILSVFYSYLITYKLLKERERITKFIFIILYTICLKKINYLFKNKVEL